MRGKRCPRCCEVKAPEEYGKNSRSKDGLAVYCKPCFRTLHAAQNEKRRIRKGTKRRVPPVTAPGTKWCPDCDACLPVESFGKTRNTKSGLATYCRPCAAVRNRASTIRLHGSSRHYQLVRKYGISAGEVDALIERQAGRCPICTQLLDERAHVDHDHATGRVRGILCFNCNAGLGKYGDDPRRLIRAAGYLERTLPAPTRVPVLDAVLESLNWMPEASPAIGAPEQAGAPGQ